MCRVVQCILEVINVVFIVTGLSLVVSGAVYANQFADIPGPAGHLAIGAIVVGVLLIFMGSFGYKAAQIRKIQGKTVRGKIMLMVYAIVVFVLFAAIAAVAIVLLVWLGGAIPKTGSAVDDKADSGITKAQEPVENFVGCVYDVCCLQEFGDDGNWTGFEPVPCKLKDGVPDIAGEDQFDGLNITELEGKIDEFKDAERSCGLFDSILDVKVCKAGIGTFRNEMANFLREKVQPFSITLITLASMLFLGWIFAVLEIFWCCGENDLPDDEDEEYYSNSKVAPKEYDDY